jgi:hypothetical protein
VRRVQISYFQLPHLTRTARDATLRGIGNAVLGESCASVRADGWRRALEGCRLGWGSAPEPGRITRPGAGDRLNRRRCSRRVRRHSVWSRAPAVDRPARRRNHCRRRRAPGCRRLLTAGQICTGADPSPTLPPSVIAGSVTGPPQMLAYRHGRAPAAAAPVTLICARRGRRCHAHGRRAGRRFVCAAMDRAHSVAAGVPPVKPCGKFAPSRQTPAAAAAVRGVSAVGYREGRPSASGWARR